MIFIQLKKLFTKIFIVSILFLVLPNMAMSQDLIKSGAINFGADFAAAPNQFLNPDGSKDGLNVDMCGEVAKKMNLDIEWTNLAFPGLVPGLQAERFDAICTAIFINPKRLKIMNMIAYVQWGEGLMVPKGNPGGVNCGQEIGNDESFNACFDALSGISVSVAAGGTTNKHLQEHSDRMVAAGLSPIKILAFDSNAETIQALVSGQSEAAYVNDPQGAYYINKNNAPFEMGFGGNNANRLAIATLKSNESLANAILSALEKMRADGSYTRIVDKWGLAAVPEFILNPS